MAQLVHCDGPGCDKTRDPRIIERRASSLAWFHVETAHDTVLDFCSDACMAAWATGSKPVTVSQFSVGGSIDPHDITDEIIRTHAAARGTAVGTCRAPSPYEDGPDACQRPSHHTGPHRAARGDARREWSA